MATRSPRSQPKPEQTASPAAGRAAVQDASAAPADPARRGPGRPPGPTPAKSAAERKRLERARLAREGLKVLQVTLPEEWVDELDRQRGATTRDEQLQELVIGGLKRQRKVR